MTKDWTPTKDHFDKLLAWLDTDGERAGGKYEHIRRSLIRFFRSRECVQAEALADEVINRVTGKIDELLKDYQGEPARFFLGVARIVFLEYRRKEFTLPMLPTISANSEDKSNDDESKFECLGLCLQEISREKRELILDYYEKEGQAKIDFRKELADELGIPVNSLRVRIHRLRESLHKCVTNCMEKRGRE